MAVTKDDVVEYLKGMSILEASELVKELEEVFGVSAAAAAAGGSAARGAGFAGAEHPIRTTTIIVFHRVMAPTLHQLVRRRGVRLAQP